SDGKHNQPCGMTPRCHVRDAFWRGSVTLMHFFYFKDPATSDTYTLSLHDALPISFTIVRMRLVPYFGGVLTKKDTPSFFYQFYRSEEHTSELQSRSDLVCRLLLEKKKLIYGQPFDLLLDQFADVFRNANLELHQIN